MQRGFDRIDKRSIFEIHRLKDLGFSNRQIAKQLQLDRGSVSKYLQNADAPSVKRAKRSSKLDPYREFIKELIKQYPDIKAPVVLQRLKQKGFEGKITILRDYIKELPGRRLHRQPFIRFESAQGEQMQIDWGHFQSLTYGTTKRKLYALVVIESYSRMLYVFFTHNQKQPALHQGLVNAFNFFGGTPKELVVDNMMTAVTERLGNLIRFNEGFLDFVRPFKITPVACNPGAAHEKGKVENSIKYLRQNFWPLRTFKDLQDVQTQLMQWLKSVANVRIHQTTGQRPVDRFSKDQLRSLPDLLPDCRETVSVLVHKDFGVRFDSNVYTVPPWNIGKKLVLKADNDTVCIYYKDKPIATHPRCWERKKRIELPSHKEQVKKLRNKLYQDKKIAVFLSLGPAAANYLQKLASAKQPLKKTVSRLLALKDEFGTASLLYAVEKASAHNLYGADYVQNILYQEMTPQTHHQPVKLKNEALNRIRLTCPSLEDYDAFALQRRNKK